jgi:hypothetical protein
MTNTVETKLIKPTVMVMGAGGHGTVSLSKLLENKDYNFQIYYSTCDWGGSYGLWGRLLELDDYALNKSLHNIILPVLPFADLNKLIIHFFDKANINAKQYLDFRSDNPKEHLAKIELLLNILKFSHQQKKLFNTYFENVWSFYTAHKLILKYNKTLCLGYLVHTFLYWITGGMEGWNKFFHNLGVLPNNIILDFTAKNRQVLYAKDLSLNEVIGEDVIDYHTSPLLPSSMRFLDKNGENATPKKQFLDNLTKADWIVIPNGSIANWLPVVNYPSIKKILCSKKIVWLTNPYRNKNELINPNYFLYFLENGIKPIAFTSKTYSQNKNFLNILLQDKNGKYNTDSIANEILKLIK